MPEVSVILPVYNVEKYINQCIESLVNQTYSDIEIILVIDGATDRSGEIAEIWKKKDSRINVLWQENSGSGPARNNGLKVANGEYIMFVDPDDWIEKNMIEVLINEMKNAKADFLTSGASNDYYESEILIRQEIDHFDKKILDDACKVREIYVPMLLAGGMGAPTKKIYRRSIIEKNNVVFPDLRRSQDIVFNYRYIEHVNRMIIHDGAFYHYRIDEKSFQTKLHPQYYKAVSMIYGDIDALLDKWNVRLEANVKNEFVKYFFELVVWQISIGNSANVMSDLVNDKVIRKIVKQAHPAEIKQKVLKWLILLKQVHIINLFMLFKKRRKYA